MAPNTLRRSTRSRRFIKTNPKSKPITKTKPPKRNLNQSITTTTSSSASAAAAAANEEQSSIVIDFRNDAVLVNEGLCSTPKGKKFRIPKIETCPPAPRKQRVDFEVISPATSSPAAATKNNCSSSSSSSSSARRPPRPISFFSPPDLELFFFFARRHISV